VLAHIDHPSVEQQVYAMLCCMLLTRVLAHIDDLSVEQQVYAMLCCMLWGILYIFIYIDRYIDR
jgi:hypothetical protein